MSWGLGPFIQLEAIHGGVFFFSKKSTSTHDSSSDQDPTDYLCRFVAEANGKHLGESVSIDGDILIIKSKEQFLGVPLKHIQEEEKKLVVYGLIDFDKAYELGESWRKRSYQLINTTEED